LEYSGRRNFDTVETTYGVETTWNNLNTAPSLDNCPKPMYTEAGREKAQPILKMLKDSICRGKKDRFEYLMVWSAYVTNYQKTGVALQLKGVQGTGKSLFSSLLSAVIHPEASFKADKSSTLTGRFNSFLIAKTLVISEEATFFGDSNQNNVLKDLITSSWLDVERKFQNDREKHKNIANFLFLTNHDRPTRIEAGDRRYVIYETSIEYSKSLNLTKAEELDNFWESVSNAISDKEALEYIQYLFEEIRATHKIGWLSQAKNQQSEEKNSNILQSLDIFDSYLLNLVETGFHINIPLMDRDTNINGSEYIDVSTNPVRMAHIFSDYKKFDSNSKYSNQQTLSVRLGDIGAIARVRHRHVYGEAKKHTAPQHLVAFDPAKVLEYLRVKGINVPTPTPLDISPLMENEKEFVDPFLVKSPAVKVETVKTETVKVETVRTETPKTETETVKRGVYENISDIALQVLNAGF
jgi:hypothetical protein